MDENEIIQDLKSKGWDKVWAYEAEPNEIDEEHQHDYDILLVILRGQILITAPTNGTVETLSHQMGSQACIEKGTPHSALADPDGCRYIVAEKY